MYNRESLLFFYRMGENIQHKSFCIVAKFDLKVKHKNPEHVAEVLPDVLGPGYLNDSHRNHFIWGVWKGNGEKVIQERCVLAGEERDEAEKA